MPGQFQYVYSGFLQTSAPCHRSVETSHVQTVASSASLPPGIPQADGAALVNELNFRAFRGLILSTFHLNLLLKPVEGAAGGVVRPVDGVVYKQDEKRHEHRQA